MADVGFMTISQIDYDGEVTNTRLFNVAITAANFAAQETLKDSLRDSIAAITLGTVSKTVYGNEDLLSVTLPSDTEAQRELKWLVQYHDTTSLKLYSCEIGCADVSYLDANDRKHANIGAAGAIDTFITNFQAVVKSPTGGAVLVDEITLVGRAL
jgi:hypothetical protein